MTELKPPSEKFVFRNVRKFIYGWLKSTEVVHNGQLFIRRKTRASEPVVHCQDGQCVSVLAWLRSDNEGCQSERVNCNRVDSANVHPVAITTGWRRWPRPKAMFPIILVATTILHRRVQRSRSIYRIYVLVDVRANFNVTSFVGFIKDDVHDNFFICFESCVWFRKFIVQNYSTHSRTNCWIRYKNFTRIVVETKRFVGLRGVRSIFVVIQRNHDSNVAAEQTLDYKLDKLRENVLFLIVCFYRISIPSTS